MNDIQQRLLQLAETRNLADYSYRQLAELVQATHPFTVKYHLEKLIENGRLIRNVRSRTIHVSQTCDESVFSGLISIPILGEANCGEALLYASGELQGFLRVSPTVLQTRQLSKMFALRARGDSMNLAEVSGDTIDDGDYVLVVKCGWETLRTGDYVVSIIDGKANIKRLMIDTNKKRIVLFSESYRTLPPIVIANEDLQYFEVAGRVEQVIKSPTFSAI